MTWVRQWLRRWEDRVQYHNMIAELYYDDQPTLRNFMTIPDARPEVGHYIKTSGHRRKLHLPPVHLQGRVADH